MSDIAQLMVSIETSGADKAIAQLSALEKEAIKAAEASKKLDQNASSAAKSTEKLGDSANKSTLPTKSFGDAASRTATNAKKLEDEARLAAKSLGDFLGRVGDVQPINSMSTSMMTAARAAMVLGSSVGTAGRYIGVGIAAIGAAWLAASPYLSRFEQAVVKLDQSLGQVGNRTGLTLRELKEFANQVEQSTGVVEEQVMGVQVALNKAGKLSGESFKQATRLALDMAESMGGTPVQAAERLARALKDPARATEQLRDVLDGLDPSIIAQIRNLVEMGDVAGAQAVILKTLADQVGGSADAQSGTLAGAWAKAEAGLGNLAKEFADFIPLATAAKTVMNGVADAANYMADAMKNSGGMASVLEGALYRAKIVAAALSGNIAGVTEGLVRLNGAQEAATKALEKAERVEKFRNNLQATVTTVKDWINSARQSIAVIGRQSREFEENAAAIRKGGDALKLKQAQDRAVEASQRDHLKSGAQWNKIAEQAAIAQATAQFNLEKSYAGVSSRGRSAARDVERSAAAYERAELAAKDYITELYREAEMVGKTAVETAELNAEYRIQEILRQGSIDLSSEVAQAYIEEGKAAARAAEEKKIAFEKAQEAAEREKELVMDIANSFTDFATSVIDGSKDAGEALMDLLAHLVEVYLQMQLMNSMGGSSGGGGFLGSIIGSIFGGGSDPLMAAAQAYPAFSKGGVFNEGRVVPMSKGRMISRPTTRDMALMGEQGPEAVLPLTRDSQGNLGVRGGGGSSEPRVIVQNIDQRKSGAAVETETQRGQNGELVIRNYIRDEVKRSISNGSMDKDMARNYGLSRNPVRRS